MVFQPNMSNSLIIAFTVLGKSEGLKEIVVEYRLSFDSNWSAPSLRENFPISDIFQNATYYFVQLILEVIEISLINSVSLSILT
jgi:hypothetical protein